MRSHLPLWQRLQRAPSRGGDAPLAESRLEGLLAANARLRDLANEPYVRDLLMALAAHSPFLWQLAAAAPARLERCLGTAPEACLELCLAGIEQAAGEGASEAAIMR